MRRVIPLIFNRAGGYAMPQDPHLHQLAVEFAHKHLAERPNFADFERVWLSADVDADGKPALVHGALAFIMRPDIVLARSLDQKAFVGLYQRAQSYFSDTGARGFEVFVYINPDEAPEQKCPQQAESLQAIQAKPANRWAVTVR
jgi:hypothetical protein